MKQWIITILDWWTKYHPVILSISIAIVSLVIGVTIIESVVSPINNINESPLGVPVDPGFAFPTLIPLMIVIALIALSLIYIREEK